LAFGFSCLFNLLLAATLVWTELFGGGVLTFGWAAALLTWSGSAVYSKWMDPGADNVPGPLSQDLFPVALGEYLRGEYFAAEATLRRLLWKRTGDVDARLLLVAVLRHSGRTKDAREELIRLERYDASGKWTSEMAQEKRRLTDPSLPVRQGETHPNFPDILPLDAAA
jgi:hypothetical protein